MTGLHLHLHLPLLTLLLLVTPISALKLRILLTEHQNRILTQSQIDSFSNIKLLLDGNSEYYYPQSNNVFSMYPSPYHSPNLTPGVHILQAVSNEYLFPVFIVDCRVEGSYKMKWLNPLDRKFIKAVNQPYISPIEKIKYFQPEPAFPVLGFLMGGNGLFILMGVVMIFCYKGMNKLAEAQMAPGGQGAPQHPVTEARRRQ